MTKPTSQIQVILDAYKEMGLLPIETLTSEIARQIPLADKVAAAVYGQPFVNRALAADQLKKAFPALLSQ